MKSKTLFFSALLAILAFLSMSIIATSIASGNTSKIDKFLQTLMKAKSLSEISVAYERARFSKVEREQLQKRLKEKQYEMRISALVTQEHQQEKIVKKILKKDTSVTKVKAQQDIKTKLIEAKSHAIAMQKPHSKPKDVRLVKASDIKMMGTAPVTGSGARITRVSPSVGTVGGTITITGSNFGERGRVALIVGKRQADRGNLAFADVSSWSETRIVVTIPRSLQSLVGESEKEGVVWVKLAGGEIGPYRDYRFRPDVLVLKSTIIEVYPDPIYPDSNILITGVNFLTDEEPTVRARSMDPTSGEIDVTLNVTEWSDNYIHVVSGRDHSSSLNRIPSGGFTLIVQNHLGQEDSKAVTMARHMSRRTIHYGHDHRVQCEYWNDTRDRPSAFCLAGDKKTFEFPYARCPDWNVVGYRIRIQEQGCCNGYSFKREPFGNNPSYEIELWANAWGYIELEVDVELEGPEGTGCW